MDVIEDYRNHLQKAAPYITGGITDAKGNRVCARQHRCSTRISMSGLLTDKLATITGLRGVFRNLGSAIGIAVATVLLYTIGDVQRAFYVVLFASALMMLISIPAIFAMPSSPNVKPFLK